MYWCYACCRHQPHLAQTVIHDESHYDVMVLNKITYQDNAAAGWGGGLGGVPCTHCCYLRNTDDNLRYNILLSSTHYVWLFCNIVERERYIWGIFAEYFLSGPLVMLFCFNTLQLFLICYCTQSETQISARTKRIIWKQDLEATEFRMRQASRHSNSWYSLSYPKHSRFTVSGE